MEHSACDRCFLRILVCLWMWRVHRAHVCCLCVCLCGCVHVCRNAILRILTYCSVPFCSRVRACAYALACACAVLTFCFLCWLNFILFLRASFRYVLAGPTGAVGDFLVTFYMLNFAAYGLGYVVSCITTPDRAMVYACIAAITWSVTSGAAPQLHQVRGCGPLQGEWYLRVCLHACACMWAHVCVCAC